MPDVDNYMDEKAPDPRNMISDYGMRDQKMDRAYPKEGKPIKMSPPSYYKAKRGQ